MPWTSPVSLVLPPDIIYVEGGLQSATTLNATTTRLAFTWKARKTTTVSALYIRVTSVTTAQSLRVSLQGTTGGPPPTPTGTVLGATNNGFGTIASPAASTTYEVTLGETVSITQGTVYAVVIEWTSTTGNLQVARRYNTSWQLPGRANVFCAQLTFASSAWSFVENTNQGVTPVFAVKTSDSNWWMPDVAMPPVTSIVANNGYNSTSSPDEYGNRIYLPAGTVNSLWVASDADGAASLLLINDSGTTIATGSLTAAERSGSSYGMIVCPIAATAITEGWYRVTQQPSTSTNVSRFIAGYDSGQANGRAMAANCYLTQRTDGGAWTDTTTSMMAIGVEMEPTFGSSGSVRSVNIRGGADQ